ncbi:DUF806 family protein [Lactobacillus kefiranofaciens]|uniref:DUF806 family protein n=1 Tax=Lactobacillus kefiranofaciens TaxID=267818 RepID=UPI0024685D93|nr:DUF806 family protein [Lactobacillus kefiranofaciens]MDH5099752.1 DUF806 family protein [Lactobacillus kefiranofaciens]
MTVAKEVTDELNHAGIKHLLKAYSFQRLKNPDLNNAVITVYEVSNSPTEHGSNLYNELISQIQIKILYNSPTELDSDTFEQSIVSFFMQRNWLRLSDTGHYIDTSDTKPMLAIDMFFRRRK